MAYLPFAPTTRLPGASTIPPPFLDAGNFGEWRAIHPIIDGIAGLHRREPRYFAEDVSDGIGCRCGR